MKKIKLLSLLLALIMVLAAFASCGAKTTTAKPVSSLNTVYNKDYVEPIRIANKMTELSSVAGYAILSKNSDFVVFSKPDGITTVTYVYSYAKNDFVGTFVTTDKIIYDVTLFADIPAFSVKATAISSDLLSSTDTYTLYDAHGNTVDTDTYNPGAPVEIADNIVYDFVLYSNTNGTLTKVRDIPENLAINTCTDWNDNYIYNFAGGDLAVYDRSFKHVYAWSAPSYASGVNAFVLNNGNVLVQYTELLDDAEKDYDIYEYTAEGNMQKYDLVSLVINPKTAKIKEADLDFVVSYVLSYNAATQDEEEFKAILNDSFENIAEINYIFDKKVDTSDEGTDIVLMGNDAKAKKSLKVADYQRPRLPKKVGANAYLVSTRFDGNLSLVDAKGKSIVDSNNNSVDLSFASIGLLVGKHAVYDMSRNKVYDFDANNAQFLGVIGRSVFVSAVSGSETKISRIQGTSETEVCTTKLGDLTSKIFQYNGDYYTIYDPTTSEFEYFNAEGTSLLKTKEAYALVSSSFDGNTLLLASPGGAYACIQLG